MKTEEGTVQSLKTKKTATILVSFSSANKKYGKIVKRTKKLKADFGTLDLKPGEKVKIQEVKPISKTKHWKVLEKIGGKNSGSA